MGRGPKTAESFFATYGMDSLRPAARICLSLERLANSFERGRKESVLEMDEGMGHSLHGNVFWLKQLQTLKQYDDIHTLAVILDLL